MFRWNNTELRLTIGDRKGTYPGMVKERTFTIVLVNENRGTGIDVSTRVDKTIKYSGEEAGRHF